MPALYSDLDGKVVLVTGGGSGIGESITRAFAAQKARVGFIDIAREASERLLAALLGEDRTAACAVADLTDIESLQDAVARLRDALGPVDILINNAANDDRHRVEDVTSAYFDERIAVNLKHQFFAAKAVLPDMVARGGGSIVNLGSIAWMLKEPELPVYTAAKSAVLGLTRSLARAYGPHNVRVNAIAPGWIMTERQKSLWLTPDGEAAMLAGQCLKRHLLPNEVARFAVFLASDEASACTAQQFVVDGGWT